MYASTEIGNARKKYLYTARILDVCGAVLIDPRLTDEVQMVLDEVVKGYEGAALGASLQGKLDQVQQSLRFLTPK